jgi:hypothetical protein
LRINCWNGIIATIVKKMANYWRAGRRRKVVGTTTIMKRKRSNG